MKKNKRIISLAVAALFCVSGAFALNANTTVSASDTKMQTMLGASVLLDGVAQDKDTNAIRFPVVVTDEVSAQIAESKFYVLPEAFWDGVNAPTAEEIVEDPDTKEFDTTGKWVNYYEDDTSVYGDGYEEAVVYMYNIPEDQYENEFYVCSYIKLKDGKTEEYSDVVARSMTSVALGAYNKNTVTFDQVSKYLTHVLLDDLDYDMTMDGVTKYSASQLKCSNTSTYKSGFYTVENNIGTYTNTPASVNGWARRVMIDGATYTSKQVVVVEAMYTSQVVTKWMYLWNVAGGTQPTWVGVFEKGTGKQVLHPNDGSKWPGDFHNADEALKAGVTYLYVLEIQTDGDQASHDFTFIYDKNLSTNSVWVGGAYVFDNVDIFKAWMGIDEIV